MDFDALREYIIGANIAPEITYNGNRMSAVFLLEKPHQIDADEYFIYSFNRLNGGTALQHYLVTIKIVCNDVLKIIDYKDRLIDKLDFYNKPCAIDGLEKFRLSNEGGIYYDDNINKYVDKLFFDCKTIK